MAAAVQSSPKPASTPAPKPQTPKAAPTRSAPASSPRDSAGLSSEATRGPGAPKSREMPSLLKGLQDLRGGETAASEAARGRPPLETGILSRNFEYGLNWPVGNGGRHDYSVRTAFPQGTTLQEANGLVNGFNAPTARAMEGRPNDPNLTGGWVDNPFINTPDWAESLDASGRVTMERGVNEDGTAWVRNTTVDGQHPFVGTITRSVEEQDGRYYVRTDGEGQGGALSNIRHYLNAQMGPEMFQELDARMLEYQARQRRGN